MCSSKLYYTCLAYDLMLIYINLGIRFSSGNYQGRGVILGISIERANKEAIEKLLNSHPFIVGIGKAIDDIPGMKKNLFLHAGPPVTWDRMCGPMKGAVLGGIVYEGMAETIEEAQVIAESGEIEFEPCHHHSTVGPMAGLVTPSMPVWIIKNKTYDNVAYCTLNEGLGKVLRYGAYGPEVITRLKWMEEELAPVLRKVLELYGDIDLKNIITQALQMGDEVHNRNKAATSLLIREIAPFIVKTGFSPDALERVLSFMHSNDHFFLNLSMPACKLCLDAAHGIEGSTLITAMARNGTDFGIRVSGLGDKWFTAPCPDVNGLYFPGFTADDANPDIGDSSITETGGVGGFAMGGAPAIVQFVGGTPQDAINMTLKMYEITMAENNLYKLPSIAFRGTPTGIDLRKVIETGILPAINTGIAHKTPGVGMVGAGLVEPPRIIFEEALEAFAKNLGINVE